MSAPSSLTSSITAAIGVLNWKRRPMSSVTLAIVRCAARVSVASTSVAPPASRSATSFDDPPQPAQEARDALDALLGPLHVLVGGPHEQDVRAHGVSAVAVGQRVGAGDVALRLRHLRPALAHPALVEQALERLADAEQAEVVQRLDEEARVQQVAGRVVDAADVLVDGHPVVDDPAVPTAPRRCAGRSSAGSTRTSRRTCPSCPARAAPGFAAASGTGRSSTPRWRRAAPCLAAGSPRSRAAATGSSSSGTGDGPSSSQ